MKRWISVAAMAAVAMLAFAATASADVPRYQYQYATLVGNVNEGQYIHTYPNIMRVNPCDGTWEFGGTGTVTGGTLAPGGLASTLTETVTGSFNGTTLDFHSVYGGTYNPGYHWDFTGPLTGGAANSGVYSIVWSMTPSDGPVYRNHGDFVSQMPDKNDAAHSCIGKPLEFSFSQSGTVPATTSTPTTITLPDMGLYRIDVSGTWINTPYGWVDAEYTDNGAGGYADGFDRAGWLLGPDFGDLKVNDKFVSWGAYNSSHAYTLYLPVTTTTLNLSFMIFDGQGGVPMPWYGDNTGGLNYTVTYIAP